MTLSLSTDAARNLPRDLLIVFVQPSAVATLSWLDQVGQTHLRDSGFQAKAGEWLILPASTAVQSRRTALVGLGAEGEQSYEAWRKCGGVVLKQSKAAKAKTLAIDVTSLPVGSEQRSTCLNALAEGMLLASYSYHVYKSEKTKHEIESKQLEEVAFAGLSSDELGSMKQSLYQTQLLVRGTNVARDLVNTPPNHLAPRHLKAEAERIAAKHPALTVTILSRADMERERLFGALAVAQGSTEPPFGAHLVYQPSRPAKKKIMIIGKAVTFDSGGLSIKPADSMMDMKCDMAGCAAVLGLFDILPELDLDLEIHGLFLAVENMPSGSAYRPGDVVTARNGVSIEVLNTDAEGRVTLADALSYACDLKPDAIIDLATLTGACIIALGDDISALLSNNRALSTSLLAASKQSAEPLWELPLYQPYGDLIKSKVADIKNIGGRPGGTITAALFLQHFVPKDQAWAHLDIAGPAYTEKERPEQPFGGSGYGVRLLARYLQAVAKGE